MRRAFSFILPICLHAVRRDSFTFTVTGPRLWYQNDWCHKIRDLIKICKFYSKYFSMWLFNDAFVKYSSCIVKDPSHAKFRGMQYENACFVRGSSLECWYGTKFIITVIFIYCLFSSLYRPIEQDIKVIRPTICTRVFVLKSLQF